MMKLTAYKIYLLLVGCQSLAFWTIFTVNLVYHATTVGMNPLQLTLVGTALEMAVLLGELPTGLLADLYSRRLSVIIGLFLMGIGFLVEGSFPTFTMVLLATIIWGVGVTFTSGALEAWVADEVGEAQAAQAFVRGAQLNQLGALAGTALSVTLASVFITLPILTGGVMLIVLAGWLLLVMPETGFKPAPRDNQNVWQSMVKTLEQGTALVRRRPLLLTIVGIGFCYGLFSEGFDRLWTAHLLTNFTLPTLGQLQPVVWFGIITAIGKALSFGLIEIVQRRVDTRQMRALVTVLLLLNSVQVLALILFGLTSAFGIALLAYWTIVTLGAINRPLYLTWVNQQAEPQVRATLFSFMGQTDAVGQLIGGPITGTMGTLVSLRSALVTAGLLLSPVLWLESRALGKQSVEQSKLAQINVEKE